MFRNLDCMGVRQLMTYLKISLIVLGAALVSGCDGAVQKFVTGVTLPVKSVLKPRDGRLKVSPGMAISKSSNISAQSTITTRDRTLKSTKISASVSINRY